MGTINYHTSDYITVGYNLNFVDYEDEFYNEIITDYYEQVKYRLEQEDFYYFHVALKPGYYEGFSLDIEFNFSWCFDTWQDKRAAQKEITQIKKFLLTCINDFECCVVFPGWCTSYKNYNDSLELLNDAIWEMREQVKSTRTWQSLPASEKYA
jgi:hypothetical protein